MLCILKLSILLKNSDSEKTKLEAKGTVFRM